MAALCHHALEATGLAGDRESPIHRLDPRAKILAIALVTIVAVSTPLASWPVFLACAGVLVAIAAAAAVAPRTIWRRARFIVPVVGVLVVFLPFVRDGGATYAVGPLTAHGAGLSVAAAVGAKALIGTVGAVLLTATTTYPAVLRGLEALRVPRLLVLISGFMYRYVFVIVDELSRMRAAIIARGFQPRTAWRAAPTGRLAGSLFLRSYARGERVYLAMLARGYGGRMPYLTPLVLRRRDLAFVAGVALAVLPLRIVAGVAP